MISDTGRLAAARAAQFGVNHIDRVPSRKTAGERVLHAVVGDLPEQLRVLHGYGQQRCRRFDNPPAIRGQRSFRTHAEHAYRGAADQQRKSDRAIGERVGRLVNGSRQELFRQVSPFQDVFRSARIT
jgi:hypothetical protein